MKPANFPSAAMLFFAQWAGNEDLGHQGSVIAKHGLNTTFFSPNQGMGDRDWRMRKWTESAESPGGDGGPDWLNFL